MAFYRAQWRYRVHYLIKSGFNIFHRETITHFCENADKRIMAKSKKRLRQNFKTQQRKVVLATYSYDPQLETWLSFIGFRGQLVTLLCEGETLEELHENSLKEIQETPEFKGAVIIFIPDTVNSEPDKQVQVSTFFALKNL